MGESAKRKKLGVFRIERAGGNEKTRKNRQKSAKVCTFWEKTGKNWEKFDKIRIFWHFLEGPLRK